MLLISFVDQYKLNKYLNFFAKLYIFFMCMIWKNECALSVHHVPPSLCLKASHDAPREAV